MAEHSMPGFRGGQGAPVFLLESIIRPMRSRAANTLFEDYKIVSSSNPADTYPQVLLISSTGVSTYKRVKRKRVA
jgi:hypothetical protein